MIPTIDESHNVVNPCLWSPGGQTLCDSPIVGVIWSPTLTRGQHYSLGIPTLCDSSIV